MMSYCDSICKDSARRMQTSLLDLLSRSLSYAKVNIFLFYLHRLPSISYVSSPLTMITRLPFSIL